MTRMSPRWRKAALTVHIVCSVGWVGAVVTYLGIAGIAMTTRDVALLHAAVPLMQQLTWWVVVPFNLLSLVSGIVSSTASPWGCSGTTGWSPSWC